MRRAALLAAALALAACATAPPAPGPQPLLPQNAAAFFDCLRTQGLAVVSAHRGGPGSGAPENSLEAMRATAAVTPALFEIDVRRTGDGRLVLMHDDTLERTTTGAGPVAEKSLAEIQALTLKDAGGGAVPGAHPPSLDEALAAAATLGLVQLDVKRGTPFDAVVDAVRAAGAQGRVMIITYTATDAAEVHRLAPEILISASIASEADFAAIQAAGIDLGRIIAFTGTRLPDARLNALLGQAGVEAIFGTLGRPGERWDDRFAATEGDAGYAAFARAGLQVIATDRPAAAATALDAADGPGFAPARCLTPR